MKLYFIIIIFESHKNVSFHETCQLGKLGQSESITVISADQLLPTLNNKPTERFRNPLLLLLNGRYTESPVCKMSVAVFSSSSSLP